MLQGRRMLQGPRQNKCALLPMCQAWPYSNIMPEPEGGRSKRWSWKRKIIGKRGPRQRRRGGWLWWRRVIIIPPSRATEEWARKKIYPGWILLDNHSTEGVFGYLRSVKNICHARGCYIMICCNSGKHYAMQEVTLKGYGTVWYDKGAIYNILYSRNIRETHTVIYYNKGNCFSEMKPVR